VVVTSRDIVSLISNVKGIPATVKSIEYDQIVAFIALLAYADGEKRMLLLKTI
jgi:ribosomal protein L2